MYTFVQYQSARAIRDATKQPGGVAGIGASMAVGKKVASSMNKSLSKEPAPAKRKEPEKPQAKAMSAADQIKKYKDLLDHGILTRKKSMKMR